MKKIFEIILIILFAFPAWNQKQLSLSDAVIGQYGSFYPLNISGFKWVPGTDQYSTIEGYASIVLFDVEGKEFKRIAIKELNSKLNTTFPYIAEVNWRNEKEFYVYDGKSYFLYNWETEKGQRIAKPKHDFENQELDVNSGLVAHTFGNNLFCTEGEITKNVTDFKDKNIVSGQAIARSEFGIKKGIFWSPKSNKIAFYQKNEENVGDYPLLDISKTPGELNSIKYPMAGQKSENAKVGIYEIKTSKVVYLEFKGGKEHYYTNLAWSPFEKNIYVAEVNRAQNEMQLNRYDAVTGRFIETVLEEKHPKYVEPEHPPYFLPDNSFKFIWLSEKDGFNNLYLIDVQTKKEVQLTKNKWVVKEVVQVTDQGVYFLATGPNPLNTMLYFVDFKGKQTLITEVEGTHTVQLNVEKGLLFDQYSNHETPNVGQILNLKGKVVKELIRAQNPYEGINFGAAEISSLTGNDGAELKTRLIKPSNFDPNKKYPVLVYVYGGPHAQLITNSWLDGASLWMYWLAEQGYLVYTLDGRGSANRGRDFENSIHRNLGKYEIEDQISGVNYLKSLPYIDGERLAVHGWSFGGFMTISLMLKQAGVFNVGVAGGPVTDWAYYEIMYGERYMDTPEENPEGYEEAALRNHVDKLEGKLMLIHGTADNVVVMQHSLDLIKNFIGAGKQVDFFPYPMHEHNVYGKDRVHLMTKVLEYIMLNNK